jgi:hypothetical protein
MNHRTKLINKAIKEFHKIHTYCIVCGTKPVDACHLIGRNVSYKDNKGKEKNDPTNKELFIPLCRRCHQDYDRHTSTVMRLAWLNAKHLYFFADKLKNIIENI